MSLMERFTHLCRSNNLEFWLDWGTLLGEHRQKNIIPWDYDIDVCLLKSSYMTLIRNPELFSDYNLKAELNYYNDPQGCFAITDLNNPSELVIDVVCYEQIESALLCSMSAEVLAAYPDNYARELNQIFPLDLVPFCGNYVHVPANVPAVLNICYGPTYMELPPEGIAWQEMLYFIPPFRSLAEHPVENQPYIIRRDPAFTCSYTDITTAFLAERPDKMWGYTDINKIQYEYLPPGVLLSNWIKGELTHILVDTECSHPELFPETLREQTSYTLTKAGHTTEFHIDPDFGGGWMYLSQGVKLWWFIAPDDWLYLQEKGITLADLAGKGFTELVCLCECYLWGKLKKP